MINSSNVDAVEMVDDTLPLLPDGPSLETCEEVIEAGIQTFYEVGQALAHIRDAQLYRTGYVTFQSYLKERWGLEFQLGQPADGQRRRRQVAGDHANTADERSVAEELAPLPTGLRKQLWEQALASTARMTGGRPNPTAQEVHELVGAKLVAASGAGLSERTLKRLTRQDQAILDKVRAGETLVANLESNAS